MMIVGRMLNQKKIILSFLMFLHPGRGKTQFKVMSIHIIIPDKFLQNKRSNKGTNLMMYLENTKDKRRIQISLKSQYQTLKNTSEIPEFK